MIDADKYFKKTREYIVLAAVPNSRPILRTDSLEAAIACAGSMPGPVEIFKRGQTMKLFICEDGSHLWEPYTRDYYAEVNSEATAIARKYEGDEE